MMNQQARFLSPVQGLAAALTAVVLAHGASAAAQANPPPQPGAPVPAQPPAAQPAQPAEAPVAEQSPTPAPPPEGAPALSQEAASIPPPGGAEGAVPPPAPATPPPAGAHAEAPGTATADASADAIMAELAAGSDGSAEIAQELDDGRVGIDIYGFADFTYNHLLGERREWNNYTFGFPSFYVGSLNFYFSSDLGANWRALSEIRFTYLPDGVDTVDMATNTSTRTSTAYPDYTDYNRPVDVGGIIIERAWVEYAAHPLFTARFGQWLTPYGIWNVDHGSPTIIGTTRPYIIGAEMFPQRQTGIELYGAHGMSDTQVGYHLTLSNGRGPVESYKDFDANKALGWRAWVQQDTDFGSFVVGTSGYRGRYSDKTQNTLYTPGATPDEPGEIANEFTLNREYKELSLAADFKWTWGGAIVQAEGIVNDRSYMDDTRPAADAYVGQGWAADYRTWGVYGIAGYRFDWYGVMPYIGGEYNDLSKTSFMPGAGAIWGGLNVRPTAKVVLKVQGVQSFYPGEWVGFKKAKGLQLLVTQIAWSF